MSRVLIIIIYIYTLLDWKSKWWRLVEVKRTWSDIVWENFLKVTIDSLYQYINSVLVLYHFGKLLNYCIGKILNYCIEMDASNQYSGTLSFLKLDFNALKEWPSMLLHNACTTRFVCNDQWPQIIKSKICWCYLLCCICWQEPQLTAHEAFDVYRKPFSL